MTRFALFLPDHNPLRNDTIGINFFILCFLINAITAQIKKGAPKIISLLFWQKSIKKLQREIHQITPTMLSKELKELELNGAIKKDGI